MAPCWTPRASACSRRAAPINLYGKKVAVHAHGADGVNAALAAGADSIEHGTLLDAESIRLFKASGAY